MVEMAKAKYSGPRFPQIPDLEYGVTCKTLLASICAITGWKLPENEFMTKAIVNHFESFTREQLSDFAPGEVAYAMRNFAFDVKDWGKDVNIPLINEPISLYREARLELSKLEEQSKPLIEAQKPVVESPDWSVEYEKLRNGQYEGQFAGLIPYSAIYDWALREGKFEANNAEKWKALAAARDKEISRLSLKKEAFQATPDERADLERIKCVDWRKDNRATALLIGEAKKSLLLTKIKE